MMRAGAFLFVCAVILVSGGARADDSARADALFDEGNALMGRNDAAGAAERYRASFDLAPRAKAALNLGIALAELGRDAAAVEAFAAYLDDPAADPAKRKVIEGEVLRLRARVGEITTVAQPPGPVDELAIDGQRSLRPGRTFVGPGPHVVSARRTGGAAATTEVSVLAGETAPARLVFAPQQARGGERSAWKWIAFGVAASAAAVGATFGVIAIDRWHGVDRHCPGGACPSQADLDRVDGARQAGTVATVAFVTCGVAAVGAVALWLTEPKSAPESERGARFSFAPVERGGVIWVGGRF